MSVPLRPRSDGYCSERVLGPARPQAIERAIKKLIKKSSLLLLLCGEREKQKEMHADYRYHRYRHRYRYPGGAGGGARERRREI